MLSVVVLSVSAGFAAEINDTMAVNDEMTIDDALAVEQTPAVSADESPVVTNDTFYNYFDDAGGLRDNVTSDELIFEGSFENLKWPEISVNRSIGLIGKNAVFNNVSLSVNADNVTVTGFTINQFKWANAISVCGGDVSVSNVTVNFVDGIEQDTVAVKVLNSDNFKLLDSVISYAGTNGGNYLNNAIRITNSSGTQIKRNKIDASLVSSYVPRVEVPIGSGNWISSPISEAVVVDSSDGVNFEGNILHVVYNSVFGIYDAIYALDFKNADNAVVKNNSISALGHTYVYGITLSGDNFEVIKNLLNITSDVYFANAIGIDGNSSNGVVMTNDIGVQSPKGMAYGIASSMHGDIKDMTYSDNVIVCNGYFACGMDLRESNPFVNDSIVVAEGNYTYGIVASVKDNAQFVKNTIMAEGSNVGNLSLYDYDLSLASMAISVKGDADIFENDIRSHAVGINVIEGKANIFRNAINVEADGNVDNYAVTLDDMQDVSIFENNVTFVGATNGVTFTNAVYLGNVSSARIKSNNFSISVPSAPVDWQEIPAGSGNYVGVALGEGIVIEGDGDIIIADNDIALSSNDVIGSYGTIYVLDVKSDGVTVKDNKINATGDEYVYGILMSGEDFQIIGNNITVTSDFYANGIDIEGPANGIVEGNEIMVMAGNSAYAVYSGMNGQNVKAEYVANKILGISYNVFGFSLGDEESEVIGNEIYLFGNYTTGIAYRGKFINASENDIVLDSSEQGNESIWEEFGVESVGIKVINGSAVMGNNNIVTSGKGISLTSLFDAVGILDNVIKISAKDDKDAYAVYAVDVKSPMGVWISENTIEYHGATQGTGINNAIYIDNVTGPVLEGNEFYLELVSVQVHWEEIPAGSSNWVAFPVSEGIVIKNSLNALIGYNNITAVYGDVIGDYDTIYVVDIDSDKAKFFENNIDATGSGYIYGIVVSGEDFEISDNNIEVASDYYANGIDVEGPASGTIEDNGIMVKANVSAYPVYSGMNGKNVSVIYTGNDIIAEAYFVIGMSIGDVESIIVGNDITATGNYTVGIAYRGSNLTVDNNLIISNASNVGNEDIWDGFGIESTGIKVVMGNSTITYNNVETTAKYAVDVLNTAACVHDNFLMGKKYIGDESVANADNAEVYNNTPSVSNKTHTFITVTEVNGNGNVSGILVDANGNPVADDEVVYSFEGENKTAKTDDEGKFVISAGNGVVVISFAEDSYLLACNASIKLTDLGQSKLGSQFNVTEGISIKTYAVDLKAGEVGNVEYFKLTDSEGNPIANANVKFAYKSVILNRTTDENGTVYLGINTYVAQVALCAMSYLGDENYNASFVAFNFDIQKKPITISASAKTYKASTKTKKYAVTIKTQKCNSRDGKVYLSSGKKLTIKINGKTYSAKTNSKGQATFKITQLTKKGRYIAVVSFAGDKTYDSASKKVKITVK